jgi:hypothetical protein
VTSSPYGSALTRKLWTDLDHILLVYVGSAAEFALVEENHWLFFTNKLPSAPLDRLVSTFAWNRKVMLVPEAEAPQLAKQIRGFHDVVEYQREQAEGGCPRISNAAFRAVGAMLIDYAIRAEEYLSGKAIPDEQLEAYYQDQRGFFEAMKISGWESTYPAYVEARKQETAEELHPNAYTKKLFEAYRKDLGFIRYHLLLLFMGHFLPETIRSRVAVKKRSWFSPFYALYPKIHGTCFALLLRKVLLPKRVRIMLR